MEDVVAKANAYWESTVKEIKSYNGERRNAPKMITTSQIRKFLTAVNSVANKVTIFKAQNQGTKELSDDLAAEIKYLQVPLVYQAGRESSRDRTIKDFIKKTNIIEYINCIGTDLKAFETFAKYIEALVAYHKYYGGKDK